MIINFSPSAAGMRPSSDGNGVPLEIVDLSSTENKIVPLPQSALPSSPWTAYPEELTPPPGYVSEMRPKPFREESPRTSTRTVAFDFSILAKVLANENISSQELNIIDSGLGRLPSEFFPEAA